MRAYPSAAYPAFSSLQHPTHSIPGKFTMASSMGNAKSPATPNTLDIPRSLSLDRTCSITLVDAAFCVLAKSSRMPLVDTASAPDTTDIIEATALPKESPPEITAYAQKANVLRSDLPA